MNVRSLLYKMARLLGDVNAVKRAPEAIGKRVVRKAAYRSAGRGIGRLLK